MKKISLIFFCVALSLGLKAQRTGLWVDGGVTFSTQVQSVRGDGSRSSITSPYAGIFIRNEYPTLLGWEVGLNFTEKGAKFPDSGYVVRLGYVGLYADGYLNFPLVHNSTFFFGPGIYVANAINGTKKYDSAKSSLDFSDQWKRLDAGFEFKAGYTYNNLVTFSAKYNIGLVRNYTSKYPALRDEYNRGKNSSFSITAGIRLAKLRGSNTLKRY